MPLKVRSHVGIVFECVQIHPGQDKLAIAMVAIVGLMHMPEKHELERWVHGLLPEQSAN